MGRSLLRATALTALLAGGGCFTPNPHGPEATATTSGEGRGSESTAALTTHPLGTTTGDPKSTVGGSEGTEDATAGTSGGPVECMPGGASCEIPSPYCVESICQGCDELGGDGYCAGRDEGENCHPGAKVCVSCVSDDDCGTQSCSDGYACVQCDEHSDCPDTACDLFVGSCINTKRQFWVDGSECGFPGRPGSDPGFGSEDQPYCWLTTALDQVGAGQSAVIRLSGSAGSLPAVDVSDRADRTLALLGQDWALGNTAAPLTVGNGNRVLLSHVNIEGTTGTGLSCVDGASVWLSDSVLSDSVVGAYADDCDKLVLERSQIQQTTGNGLEARSSDVSLVSSMVVRTGETGADASAVRFVDSTFDMRYTTIVGSLGTEGRASVYCSGSGGGEVRNSLVVSPSAPSVDCPIALFSGTASDTEVPGGGRNVLLRSYELTWFADLTNYDARLASRDNPFVGVANWSDGDPRSDFEGTRRRVQPERGTQKMREVG